MGPILVYALASLVAIAILLATVLVLRPRLRAMLIELCRSEARAGFWVTVSTWWIVIIGVLAGTASYGYSLGRNGAGADLVAAVMTQLRIFLAGMLGAILVLALGLPRWIRRYEEPPAAPAPRPEPPVIARLSPGPPSRSARWPVS
ncbi:MAG TPA: hypothetical protein VMU20_06980 [Candidatus Dormibacteraeota bacterium]|nr:hypothetical protein [Candidatus Dormibacteraeota bacterium]